MILKNILKLNRAQELNRAEQKTINGGKLLAPECSTDEECGSSDPFYYTDPLTGHVTCYTNGCSTEGQCHFSLC